MICNSCPRNCGVDRAKRVGACGVGEKIKVAKIMHHMWEEPVISGDRFSGTIFFSGCPLRCVYCQNAPISHECHGEEMTEGELADAMLKLQSEGAHNINLVSPTQFSSKIRDALDLIRGQLKIPVVYNTGGYEKADEIEKMSGYVDIFLTDIKYFSTEASKKYSGAPDYFENAILALGKMLELQPSCVIDENGIMQRGVILRHLVLPTLRKDSMRILEAVKERYGTDSLKLSLMSQYTPDFCPEAYGEIKRRVTSFEYQSVVDRAVELGFDGYIQETSSASAKYTPNFRKEQK